MQKALSVFLMGKHQVIIRPALGLAKGHSPRLLHSPASAQTVKEKRRNKLWEKGWALHTELKEGASVHGRVWWKYWAGRAEVSQNIGMPWDPAPALHNLISAATALFKGCGKMGEIISLDGEGSRQTAGLLPSQLGEGMLKKQRAFAGQEQFGFLLLDGQVPSVRDCNGTHQLLCHTILMPCCLFSLQCGGTTTRSTLGLGKLSK